jgi:GxxExxY protein
VNQLVYKNESFKIVGLCMEVHKLLGRGFSENVYKDAMEYEFKNSNIPYQREKEYTINYKNITLPHKFYADFVVYDKIIIEVKCGKNMIDEHVKQTLNYLAVSKCPLGIIVNFGEDSLKYKRLVL